MAKRGRALGTSLSPAGELYPLPGPGGLCDHSAVSAARRQTADPEPGAGPAEKGNSRLRPEYRSPGFSVNEIRELSPTDSRRR
jgi:hypothetical protein